METEEILVSDPGVAKDADYERRKIKRFQNWL